MIKAIFFDIGGVYITVSGTAEEIIKNMSDYLGLRAEDVTKVLEEIFPYSTTGKINGEEFCFKVATKLNTKPETIDKLWTPDNAFKINKPVEHIVVKLKEKGYFVGAITDTDPLHLKAHRKKGTYNIFDICINSVDAKSTKSEKEIYIKALKAAKAKPEECVMIDDTESKLAAAKELGMKTILFKGVIQLKRDLKKLGVKI